MNTVRIILPNDFIIEATVDQATEILNKISSGTTLTPEQNQERLKKQNESLRPKIQEEINNIKEDKVVPVKPAKQVKTVVFPVPVTARLTVPQRQLIQAAFYYAPDKATAKGKAAYIAAILMDRQIYTVDQLKKLADAPTSTVTFAIRRLREAGSKVDTSSTVMSKNTLVQLSRISKPKFKVARTAKNAGPKPQNLAE